MISAFGVFYKRYERKERVLGTGENDMRRNLTRKVSAARTGTIWCV